MPQLMFTCPRKQRPVPTNRTMSPAAFATAAPASNDLGPCPHCGETHTWTMADAYFAGDPQKLPIGDVRHLRAPK
jgi:hypothetical protein